MRPGSQCPGRSGGPWRSAVARPARRRERRLLLVATGLGQALGVRRVRLRVVNQIAGSSRTAARAWRGRSRTPPGSDSRASATRPRPPVGVEEQPARTQVGRRCVGEDLVVARAVKADRGGAERRASPRARGRRRFPAVGAEPVVQLDEVLRAGGQLHVRGMVISRKLISYVRPAVRSAAPVRVPARAPRCRSSWSENATSAGGTLAAKLRTVSYESRLYNAVIAARTVSNAEIRARPGRRSPRPYPEGASTDSTVGVPPPGGGRVRVDDTRAAPRGGRKPVLVPPARPPTMASGFGGSMSEIGVLPSCGQPPTKETR